MAGVGEAVGHTRTAVDAVDKAGRSVRAACDRLTAALAELKPLVPDSSGPEIGELITSYTETRDALLAQLTVLDRASKAAIEAA